MNESEIEKIIKKCEECKLTECIKCEINWTQVQKIKEMMETYKDMKNYLLKTCMMCDFLEWEKSKKGGIKYE